MPKDTNIERIEGDEGMQFRSASENVKTGLAAAALAAPFVKPAYGAIKDKLTKDAETPVVIPPGTMKPGKD